MLAKYKFTIISLFVILLAAVPLILLSSKKPAQPTQQAVVNTPTATPTVAPLTPQNAATSFSSTNAQIQTSLNQANTDLNSLNQIDTSQDSVNGL